MDSGGDKMMLNEQRDLLGRVISLETKSQQQEDEIVCLKSALSDVIRRLQAVESGKGAQNMILPNKPAVRAPAKASNAATPRGNSAPIRKAVAPVESAAPPAKAAARTKSTTSNNSSTVTSPVKKVPPSAAFPTESADSTVIAGPPDGGAEDASVRLVLRGRGVGLYAPSSLDYKPTLPGSLPDEKLKLDWVYGYRGKDARNNLFVLASGEVVYFIAATVVIYHLDIHAQRFYLEHNDDVKSLAVHPNGVIVASGQVASHDKKEGKPHVRVWDSATLNTLHIIGLGEMDRAVGCVSFSKVDGGQYLLAVDESNDHVMSIWDWQKGEKGHKIAEAKTSGDLVLCAEFNAHEKMQMVTCGKGHVAFWTLENGVLNKKLGLFEKQEKPKFVTCLMFAESGDVITGDTSGNLLVWSKGSNKIARALNNVHEGGVGGLCVLSNGSFVTGGKDRKIIQWDSQCQKIGSELEVPAQYGPVRTLAVAGDIVLAGTTKNALVQSSLVSPSFTAITEGHTDELWGIASHPSQLQFVTAGNDGVLYLWDALAHVTIAFNELPVGGHCCSFHSSGSVIAVGAVDGRWFVLDAATRQTVHAHQDGNDCINCIAYSPDGSKLAIGSKSGYVVVYSTTDNGQKYLRVGKCQGHTSAVSHLDWSADSQYLQSNSTDYELLFWSAANCQQVKSSQSMRDVEWATQTCTIAFGSAGIWQEGEDGTDVNACAKANRRPLLASADDFGRVNLYKYPCCQLKSPRHSYGGHSSHVTNVSFLHDDVRLLSAGGGDGAVLQWEVLH